MDALLLTDADLVESTPLGGNIDPDKYRLCVNDAQVSKLEEILGETLYEKIKTEFSAVPKILAGDYLILYTKYIKPFLIHQSAVEYLLIGAYQIANGGIYKHAPANSTPVEVGEVNFLVKNQRAKAEMYQARLERYLAKTNFPEWTYNSNNTVNPTPTKSRGGFSFF